MKIQMMNGGGWFYDISHNNGINTITDLQEELLSINK